jgi:lambda repressor-like predicted transcriptional regulator
MGHARVTVADLKETHNLNVAKVARWLGIHRSYVSRVLHGHKKTQYVRRAIAARCGLKPEQIWPERKAS